MAATPDATDVAALFRKFDANGDGVVQRDELATVLQKVDAGKFPEELLNAMLDEVDVNKDGAIDYDELVQWIFQEGELQQAVLTAAPAIIMPIEDAIVQELTWARTQPKEVAEVLRGRLDLFSGKDFFPPERRGTCIVTKEGVSVVEEAIEYLEALEPMGGVGEVSVEGLALAGEDHVADIGTTGTASHDSSDGTGAARRVMRYGNFAYYGEALWYGSHLSDARAIVLDLIVDDGVESRGHRKNVYQPRYNCVGVAYGPHKTFGRMAALELAQDYVPDEDDVKARLANGPVQIDPDVVAKAEKAATTHWKLGNCAGCGEPIKGGRVVDVPEAGGKMHLDCFKCNACSKPLSGQPFRAHASKAYCSDCHAERFGPKCKACGETIAGGMVKCRLGTFHVECLKCSTCNEPIGRAKFSTDGGVMTCVACHTSPKAKARPKAKGKAKSKAKAKASMGAAKSALDSLGMDYASLA